MVIMNNFCPALITVAHEIKWKGEADCLLNKNSDSVMKLEDISFESFY